MGPAFGLMSGGCKRESVYGIWAVSEAVHLQMPKKPIASMPVEGNNGQITRHSALNHWQSPQPVETGTYSLLDKGPCWIHPVTLKDLKAGEDEHWMGLEITLVTRSTYDTLPYQFLPAKALLALNPQRELVKINYMIAYNMTGTAYFDAETVYCYSIQDSMVMYWFFLC